MKIYTEKEVAEWLKAHMCVEKADTDAEDEITYWIHIDENGELCSSFHDEVTSIEKTVDYTEWMNDDGPGRFYEEFENDDNPEFIKLVKELTEDINREIAAMQED